jgi:hypothetical protein
MGVAGLIGQVYGETTPSITGVAVVGPLKADYAINVYFEGRSDTLWFAPELLSFVDHGPGTKTTLGKASYVRSSRGEWVPARQRPWWQFWK